MRIIGFSLVLALHLLLLVASFYGELSLIKRYDSGDFVFSTLEHVIVMVLISLLFFYCFYILVMKFVILKFEEDKIIILWPLRYIFPFCRQNSRKVIQVKEISKVVYNFGFRGFDAVVFYLKSGTQILVPIDVLYPFRKLLFSRIKKSNISLIEKHVLFR